MNEKKFKQTFKPSACTSPPWYNLIHKDNRENTIRKIRQETLEIYGYSMDECPKRKVCLTKNCIGRPLPWNSPTAKPYLEQLKTTHKILNDELYVENCDACKIKDTCTSPCHQLNSYLNRGQDKEPNLIYQDSLEQHILVPVDSGTSEVSLIGNKEIPWDCLTETKTLLVKKYLYEGKDFLAISKEMDLNNQARTKYEFYSALTKLSEFGVMRTFIQENKQELEEFHLLILNSLYFDNKTLTDVAKDNNITKQAVQQLLKRIKLKYNLKWTKFVKKQGNKIIYNVPGLFK